MKTEQFCPYCEKRITPNGFTCFDCQKKYSLDGLLVATSYQNKTVAKAIHLYKYRFVEKIGESLGSIILRAIQKSEIPLPDLIVPIPLHPRRLRWRGFNQSKILSAYLAEKITPGFPLETADDLLERTRHTQSQMKIKNHAQRRKNIENAFKLSGLNKKKIRNRRILLIDDVATTGATIFECARVLKKSGAQEVLATVIARQEINSEK